MDWSKFTWVGSTTPTNAFVVHVGKHTTNPIQDVPSTTVPPKCGATGTGNTGYYLPRLLEDHRREFSIVTGYESGASIELAVERGEVQCRAFTVQEFFGRSHLTPGAAEPGAEYPFRRQEARPAFARSALSVN